MQSFRDIYKNDKICDMSLLINKEEIKAHKVVLYAGSPVMKNDIDSLVGSTQNLVINLPDWFKVESFEYVMKYMYIGKLEELDQVD